MQWETLNDFRKGKGRTEGAGSTKKKMRYSHLQNEQTECEGNNPPEHMNGCAIQVPTLGSHHCIILHISNQP